MAKFIKPSKKTVIIAAIAIVLLGVAITGATVFLRDKGNAEAANLDSLQTQEDAQTVEQTADVKKTDNGAGNRNANRIATNAAQQNETDNIEEAIITRIEEEIIPEKQVSEKHYIGWTPMDIDADLDTAGDINNTKPDEIVTTKTAEDTVKQGEAVTYTITVENKTDRDLENLQVKDALDAEVLDTRTITYLDNSEEATLIGNVLVWNVNIKAKASLTIKFSVIVKSVVEPGTILRNSVITNGKEINPIETEIEKATTAVKVSKEWKNMNSDAARDHSLGSIKATLAPSGDEVVLNDQNNWEYTFENLTKYDDDGNEIVYTVSESATSDADQAILDKYYSKQQDGTKLINTFDLSKVDDQKTITIVKEWKDDTESARPSNLKVSLSNNIDVEMTSSNATTTSSIWSKEISVNKYDANGMKLTYAYNGETSTDVNKFASYTATVDETVADTIKVTNTYTAPEVTGKTFTKNGTETITSKDQPVSYTVEYKATVDNYKGKATVTIVDTLPYAIDLSKSNIAGGTYDEANKTITWTEEIEIDTFANNEAKGISITKNISVVYVNMDVTVGKIENKADAKLVLDTNNETIEEEQVKTETEQDFTKTLTVVKEWKDDTESVRPSDITIKVTNTDGVKFVKSENSGNVWIKDITVNKYDTNGNELTYAYNGETSTDTNKFASYIGVVDETVADTIKVTNTYTAPEETEISITKVWNDIGNNANRPSSIEVTVNGNDGNSYTRTISSSDDWNISVSVPKYDLNYNEIEYEVIENTSKDGISENYETAYENDGNDWTITNTSNTIINTFENVKKWNPRIHGNKGVFNAGISTGHIYPTYDSSVNKYYFIITTDSITLTANNGVINKSTVDVAKLNGADIRGSEHTSITFNVGDKLTFKFSELDFEFDVEVIKQNPNKMSTAAPVKSMSLLSDVIDSPVESIENSLNKIESVKEEPIANNSLISDDNEVFDNDAITENMEDVGLETAVVETEVQEEIVETVVEEEVIESQEEVAEVSENVLEEPVEIAETLTEIVVNAEVEVNN